MARRIKLGYVASMGFWRTKTLAQMSRAEWESLCDGCGRCCLHKLRDDDTGEIEFTNVACRLLDISTARCQNYANRKSLVPDCVKLTPKRLEKIDWLPPSCAYRLVHEGKELPPWHPLRSGSTESVAQAGASVAGRCIDERHAGPLEHHVTDWPGKMPGRRQR
ncbi:MAG: YcgN family cysteine cluster protein [Rhodospirillales bacterium]|nr:YcgN family cysteine cluster protein [Rhodospirillales bacterium]